MLICWFGELYYGYVKECPCFYKIHAKVVRHKGATSMQITQVLQNIYV